MTLDNYPPGMDPKELDESPETVIRDNIKVKYYLTVEVDDDVVFESTYRDDEDMQQALRKVDAAIEERVKEIVEEKLEVEED